MGIYDAPRGSTEDEWLDIVERLVSQLEAVTASAIAIGPYWGKGSDGGVSFCCRLRSAQALAGFPSDAWEASLCIDGDQRGTWADVLAFPFLASSAIDPRGRLADRGPDAENDQQIWFQFADGDWRLRGWSYPDGPGEWAWVKRPGDACVAQLGCRPAAQVYRAGEPIAVLVEPDSRYSSPADAAPAVSLLSAFRGHLPIAPWTDRLPRSSSPHAYRFDRSGPALDLDLRRWPVAGDWVEGTYQVALRVQSRSHPGQWCSDISAPFEFRIAGDAG